MIINSFVYCTVHVWILSEISLNIGQYIDFITTEIWESGN